MMVGTLFDRPEVWCALLVGCGLAAFAACGAIAFALDAKAQIAQLRVDARRLQIRHLRERARRLGR